MVFYLIGLGLGDVEDITVKGLNVVKRCSRVYLEAYTSILCYGLDKKQLEAFYGREVIEADRTAVEQESDEILSSADKEDVAMLVVGDPFGATTHADLVLRAKALNIPVKVIHNASIMNAVGCCGLQLYSFGETVSIVMWLDGWEPDSFYDRIASNLRAGQHTLCLLDIKTKEQSTENLIKGRKIYEPARYLTCAEACQQLLTIAERKKKAGVEPQYGPETKVVGLARVGWDDQKGVKKTRVGYAGGTTPKPTYRDIGDHTEITEVQFDPTEVSFRDVVAWFWKKHDPTVKHKKQYQSAILYVDESQHKVAEETKKEVETKKGKAVETYIQAFDVFHQAEDYHQKYWLRGRGQLLHDLGLKDHDLVDSYLAAKLNAYLAGYEDFTELDQLAKEHNIPHDLVEDIKGIAKNGGDPRNCHH